MSPGFELSIDCRLFGDDRNPNQLCSCGTTWACDLYDVRPDILLVGKALGGGVPIGAFITRKDLIPKGLESEPWHMLTFMNQPLSAAAPRRSRHHGKGKTLRPRPRPWPAATERFRQLAKRYNVIGDVRGPGLFVGVDFVENREHKTPATAACRKAWGFALDRGLITQFGGFASNVLKFKPPLTTPQVDFDEMLNISEETVAFIQREVEQTRGVSSTVVPAIVGD